ILITQIKATEVNVNPNVSFLIQVYHDLLKRAPEAVGLNHWLSQLEQGISRAQIVEGIQNSPEYLRASVQDLYGSLLGRPADPVGLSRSLSYLGAGGSLDQVRLMILASPEYFLKRGGGTNAGFLAAVYQDVLHRGLDISGAASWMPLLDRSPAGSGANVRTLVAAIVSQSDEATAEQTQALYRGLLHREADNAGLTAFISARRHGGSDGSVLASIAASDEYFARTAFQNSGVS